MFKNTKPVLLAAVLSLCGTTVLVRGALIRVCYYSSWSSTLQPADIDPSLCTHLMFAFSNLEDNAVNLAPFSPDEVNMYLPFTHLKASNPELKTMLSVGGWTMGSELFKKLVSSEENMSNFTENTIRYLRRYNFDGLDIDWEYPAARGSLPEDKANFVTLIKMLQDGFANEPSRRPRLLLTAAVGTPEYRVDESYDVQALSRYLDFINLMLYDFHGEWDDTVNVHSALFSDNDAAVDRYVKYWISQGAPKNKLVIGVPFYGRMFTLADEANAGIGANHTGGGDIPYYEICQQIQSNNITPVVLSTERVPYFAYGGNWVGYDDVRSITEKGQYIRTNGLAGAMVWAIDLDDTRGLCGQGVYPLMHALKSALMNDNPVVGR